MSKNIVVFIDGTGCDGKRDKDTTNVWKLHEASLGQEHLNLYLPGVGSGTWDIFGGLVGFGTKERLEEAYNFLVKNHDDGDHIFLFGFSRGALAVRLFAAFSATWVHSSAARTDIIFLVFTRFTKPVFF
jgi:uncharacterized protein (DUF2235 family)